jgi:hypothetical protein
VTQSIATDRELTAAWRDIFLLDLRDALALAIDIAQKSEPDTTLQDLQRELESVEQQAEARQLA